MTMESLEKLTEEVIHTVNYFLEAERGVVPLTTFILLPNHKTIPLVYPETSVQAYSDILRAFIKLTDATAYVVASNALRNDEGKPKDAAAIFGSDNQGNSIACFIDIEKDEDGGVVYIGNPIMYGTDTNAVEEFDFGAFGDLFGDPEGWDTDAVISKLTPDFISDIKKLTEAPKVLH